MGNKPQKEDSKMKNIYYTMYLVFLLSMTEKIFSEKIKNEFLIKLKSPIPEVNINSIGTTVRKYSNFPLLYHKNISQEKISLFLSNYENNIEYIEPVYKVYLINHAVNKIESLEETPNFSDQWGLENNKDTDINIRRAWTYTKGKKEIIVAVIDTGVDYNHKDLNQTIWVNQNEIPDNNIDDDHNGYIDDTHGWNFYAKTPDPFDDNGHGTHCAGIVAGQGIRAWGAAPGVSIMALKFLSGAGSGSTADAIAAVDYAITMGAHVLSNSWGGGEYSRALKESFVKAQDKNILVIAAAGNYGQDLKTNKMYPAALNLSNLIAVANINEFGNLHLSSNYSKELVHLAAPGTKIFSTYPDNSYASLTGTSMAAPFVSAAAALMLSFKEDLNFTDVKKYLILNAKKLSPLKETNQSDGSLDIAESLKDAENKDDDPQDPNTPPPDDDDGDDDDGDDDDDDDDDEIFDPDAIILIKSSYKRWYQVHHRLSLKLTTEGNELERINKVAYSYSKDTGIKESATSQNRWDNFYEKVKTKLPKQAIEIKISLKNGKQYTITR